MCLILKQAITPLCAPRTIPLTLSLCSQASDFTLCGPRHWLYPYVYVPKTPVVFKWLCPETRRRYSKEVHEQNTDNDVWSWRVEGVQGWFANFNWRWCDIRTLDNKNPERSLVQLLINTGYFEQDFFAYFANRHSNNRQTYYMSSLC